MPYKNYCWWHLILTCHGHWLPGDPRGFRSRHHRVHSSGDYKHRPPIGEHEGLHDYHRGQSGNPVEVPKDVRPRLGVTILRKASAMHMPCLALAVGHAHAHLLSAAVNDWKTIKQCVGRLKQASSHAVRDVLPGQVWAEGGKPIRVCDRDHQRAVFQYILNHKKEGAWIWRFDREEGDPGLRSAQARLLDNLLNKRDAQDA